MDVRQDLLKQEPPKKSSQREKKLGVEERESKTKINKMAAFAGDIR
jgi:hypothetical protein